jgi:hypothetical protein
VRERVYDNTFLFSKTLIEDGTIDLRYCPTSKNESDVITEGLERVKHDLFVTSVGVTCTTI